MRSRTRWFVFEVVIRPVVTVIGFVVTTIYGVLFGYWGSKALRRKIQQELEQDVRDQLAFLFAEHGAEIVPTLNSSHPSMSDAEVTVAVEGLLLRFGRWHREFQVQVTSEKGPESWHELSLLLKERLPERDAPCSVTELRDAERLIEEHLSALKEIFTGQNYAPIKAALDRKHEEQMRIARQYQNEINRRLYDCGPSALIHRHCFLIAGE